MSFRILLYFIYFLILPVLCSDDILPLYLWVVNSFWLYFEYIFRIFVLNYCHYWSFYVFSSYYSLYVITLPVWDQGFPQYVWKRLLQDVPHNFGIFCPHEGIAVGCNSQIQVNIPQSGRCRSPECFSKQTYMFSMYGNVETESTDDSQSCRTLVWSSAVIFRSLIITWCKRKLHRNDVWLCLVISAPAIFPGSFLNYM